MSAGRWTPTPDRKIIAWDYQGKHSSTVLKENEKHITKKVAANLLAETFRENSELEVPREKTTEIQQKIKFEREKEPTNNCMTENFSMNELNSAIKKLKNKKSPGIDGITNEMIKHLSITAKTTLLKMFNQSWTNGQFPNTWKEATIIPIAKKRKRQK